MKKNIQTHKTDLGKGIFQLGDSVLLGSLNTPAQAAFPSTISAIPFISSHPQYYILFSSLSLSISTMALKAVHVSDVPNLDHVPENASFSLYSSRFSKGS